MVTLLVWIVIICIVAWAADYIRTQFPPPEPVNKVARVAIIVIALICIVWLLMGAFNVSTPDLPAG
jgi:hypothetical protein